MQGIKTFVVVHNDRGYNKGDSLTIQEVSLESYLKTGRVESARIIYVYSGLGINKNFVCLGFELIGKGD